MIPLVLALRRNSSNCVRRNVRSATFSTAPSKKPKQPESIQFSMNREGDILADNWSLVNDGVTAVGNAYRNARIELLTNRFPVKVEGKKVVLDKISYTGSYKVLEAGDSITHDEFSELLDAATGYLSSGVDLFVEDAAVIPFSPARIGVRVVTDNPAIAALARSILIPIPPRPTIPIARFDGWHFDERAFHRDFVEGKWDGTEYKISKSPSTPGKGERPIVAFASPGDKVAVQFVEIGGKIAGANIVYGASAPFKALVDAISMTASVLSNEKSNNSLAVDSVVISSGKTTVVVVNGNESLIETALSKNVLYGAYANIIGPDYVSTFFNGVITAAPVTVPNTLSVPAIIAQGKAVKPLIPDNAIFPMTHLVFYDEKASKVSLSVDDAVQRLVKLSDEKFTDAIKTVVGSNVKISTEKGVSDVLALLNQ